MQPLTLLDDPNQVAFETKDLTGRLQLQGVEHGLRSLTSRRAGHEWINPETGSILWRRELSDNSSDYICGICELAAILGRQEELVGRVSLLTNIDWVKVEDGVVLDWFPAYEVTAKDVVDNGLVYVQEAEDMDLDWSKVEDAKRRYLVVDLRYKNF